MFCHEGPWHNVDRIWTIRTDGSERKLMHKRTMDMEIAGHEFFSADGKTIWYDLQTPKSKVFWLAGIDIDSGEDARVIPLRGEEWSVHFNVSPDGSVRRRRRRPAQRRGARQRPVDLSVHVRPRRASSRPSGSLISRSTTTSSSRTSPLRPIRSGSRSGRTCTAPRMCTPWRLPDPAEPAPGVPEAIVLDDLPPVGV